MKVYLTWANSSGDDVIRHEVYRKEGNSDDWKLVYTVDSKKYADSSMQSAGSSKQDYDSLRTDSLRTAQLLTEQWTDENVKEGQLYSYTMIAVDDSELESDPAPPLTVIVPKTSLYPPLEGLYGEADKEAGTITIRWKTYKEPNASKITIYKGVQGKAMNLLKEITMNTKGVVDSKVKPNNTYEYVFRVVFKDGRVSEISTLNVKY